MDRLKIRGFRWFVVSLVTLATVINYIDRNALAIMWPAVSQDIGASKDDYANLVVVFTLFYALGQSAFGKIFDAIGTRMGFVTSIVIWSASIALHAVARSVGAFAILRAMLAFSEAGNWPGAVKANAEWFPPQERALAQGIFNSGASLGAIVSLPLIAWLFTLFGWAATFAVVGVLGALWVIPWLVIYKAGPAIHPWLTDKERIHILGAEGAGTEPNAQLYAPSMKQLLSHKESWAIILSRLFLDPIWWLFVSWLPIYLAQSFGFDIQQIGAFGWVPYVGAMLGALSGGWLAQIIIRSGRSVGFARKATVIFGGLLMLPALLLTGQASEPLAAVLLIAVILFGFQVAIGNIQTLPSDYYHGSSVGLMAGMGGTAAVLSVLVVTKLVPVMTTVSFAPVFIMSALFVPLSIASLLLLGGKVGKVRKEGGLNIVMQKVKHEEA
jgi:MFS transporter, ACS family, hexuronate transporter